MTYALKGLKEAIDILGILDNETNRRAITEVVINDAIERGFLRQDEDGNLYSNVGPKEVK